MKNLLLAAVLFCTVSSFGQMKKQEKTKAIYNSSNSELAIYILPEDSSYAFIVRDNQYKYTVSMWSFTFDKLTDVIDFVESSLDVANNKDLTAENEQIKVMHISKKFVYIADKKSTSYIMISVETLKDILFTIKN